MTPTGVIRGRRDLFMTVNLCGRFDLVPQKVTGSLEVTVTYFMTPKVNLTFDIDQVMTPKGHGVIRDDTLWPQRSLDLWPWPFKHLRQVIPGNTIMGLGCHGVPYSSNYHVHFYYADEGTP